jgi:hypothetical protein
MSAPGSMSVGECPPLPYSSPQARRYVVQAVSFAGPRRKHSAWDQFLLNQRDAKYSDPTSHYFTSGGFRDIGTEAPVVGKRYRLKTPTLAIMNQKERLSVMIPLGGVVQVTAGPLDQDRLVDVEWEGKALLMFTADLRERCELVDGDG